MSDPNFSIGYLFSRSYAIIAGNFMPFLAIALLASLPAVVLQVMQAMSFNDTRSGAAADPLILYESSYFWLVWAVALFFMFVAYIAYMIGAARALAGEPVNIRDMLEGGIDGFLPLLGLILVILLGYAVILIPFLAVLELGPLLDPGLRETITFIAALCIVVALFIAALRLCVLLPVLVMERPGIFQSFKRSVFLTKGHVLKIFGLLLLWIVIFFAFGAVNMTIMAMLPMIAAFILSILMTALLMPYLIVQFAVLHHELRRIKDGVRGEPVARVFD